MKISTVIAITLIFIAGCAMLSYLASYLFSPVEAFNAAKVNLADINPKDPSKANSIFKFSALDTDGNVVNFSKYDGQVTYIVNVASK